MPHNQIKKYNDFLEINHLDEYRRNESLRAVYDRDITNNLGFLFRAKIIRPLKTEGVIDMDVLFKHLTYETIEEREGKKKIKRRNVFDFERSKRLHWLWHHIQEKNKENLDVFSHLDRIDGKDVIRTYIYDFKEKYVVILSPQSSKLDYYLITAYYATEKKGGIKQIENKRKNRLPEVY